MTAYTLYEKLWNAHAVAELPGGDNLTRRFSCTISAVGGIAVILGALAVVALLVVIVFWHSQVLALWNALTTLFVYGSLVWLVLQVRHWLRQ